MPQGVRLDALAAPLPTLRRHLLRRVHAPQVADPSGRRRLPARLGFDFVFLRPARAAPDLCDVPPRAATAPGRVEADDGQRRAAHGGGSRRRDALYERADSVRHAERDPKGHAHAAEFLRAAASRRGVIAAAAPRPGTRAATRIVRGRVAATPEQASLRSRAPVVVGRGPPVDGGSVPQATTTPSRARTACRASSSRPRGGSRS